MKRIYFVLAMLFVIAFASASSLKLSFSPHSIKLNRMSTFDLDPINPQQQADFTTLRIQNMGEETYLEISIELKWNNLPLIGENELLLKSGETLGNGQSMAVSNRDLINEGGSLDFDVIHSNFDIMSRAQDIPDLEDALLAGHYPDGRLQLLVKGRPVPSKNWSAPAVFNIEIRNVGSIYLSSPGSQINQVPPKISEQMLSFFWSAFVPEFNQQKLRIKEFPPNLLPQSHNVNRTGAVIYESEEGVESGLNLPLALNDGCYYAWQVYIPVYGIHQPYEVDDKRRREGGQLESNWYVFQYIEDQDESEVLDEFYIALQNLGNREIINLLLNGFRATGEVSLDGRIYTGQDALALIQSLMGKYYQVEILD